MPSKPVPIGFKIWVLANAGYVLDWIGMLRVTVITQGPQELDPLWTEAYGLLKFHYRKHQNLSSGSYSPSYKTICSLSPLPTSQNPTPASLQASPHLVNRTKPETSWLNRLAPSYIPLHKPQQSVISTRTVHQRALCTIS